MTVTTTDEMLIVAEASATYDNATGEWTTQPAAANGKPPTIGERLAATRHDWQATLDGEQAKLTALRSAVDKREKQIATALANIERWKAENDDDRFEAKYRAGSVESQRKQLAELDKALAKVKAEPPAK